MTMTAVAGLLHASPAPDFSLIHREVYDECARVDRAVLFRLDDGRTNKALLRGHFTPEEWTAISNNASSELDLNHDGKTGRLHGHPQLIHAGIMAAKLHEVKKLTPDQPNS